MPASEEVKRSYVKSRLPKAHRIAIVRRAREILTDPKRWTKGKLRKKVAGVDRYCLLGACERASYDLGYAVEGEASFRETPPPGTVSPPGYAIGQKLSLRDYSMKTRGCPPYHVNDRMGHEAALQLLDDYAAYLEKTPAWVINP